MIEKWLNKIPKRFNMVEFDTFQIMPNHIHTIIRIVGADPCIRPSLNVSGSTHGSTPTIIGMIIQWFKTMSTNEYIKNVHDEKCRREREILRVILDYPDLNGAWGGNWSQV